MNHPETTDQLIAFVRNHVPKETRDLAKTAWEMFGDRPTQNGLDEVAGAVKLAWHLHKMGATRAELLPVLMEQDRRVTWRPKVNDFVSWLGDARANAAADRMRERNARRIWIHWDDGTLPGCLVSVDVSEVAGAMAKYPGARLSDGQRERMKELGHAPPLALPAPTMTNEERAAKVEALRASVAGLGMDPDAVLPALPEPTFAEWLMGWPPQWSNVKTDYGSLETAWFHYRRHLRTAFYSTLYKIPIERERPNQDNP